MACLTKPGKDLHAGLPAKPTGLSQRATAEWDRLLGELEESGLQITKAHWDTPAVLQMAEKDQAGARLG